MKHISEDGGLSLAGGIEEPEMALFVKNELFAFSLKGFFDTALIIL